MEESIIIQGSSNYCLDISLLIKLSSDEGPVYVYMYMYVYMYYSRVALGRCTLSNPP